jgi:hypothetical protein
MTIVDVSRVAVFPNPALLGAELNLEVRAVFQAVTRGVTSASPSLAKARNRD